MISKAILLGRIGNKNNQVTRNGKELLTLSIATTRNYRDSNGQKQQQTSWHNVNFFGKLAEIANTYTEVGHLIYIEGEIRNQKYEKNGETKWSYSITANELKLLPQGENKEKKPPNTPSNGHSGAYVDTSSSPDYFDDMDIPF